MSAASAFLVMLLLVSASIVRWLSNDLRVEGRPGQVGQLALVLLALTYAYAAVNAAGARAWPLGLLLGLAIAGRTLYGLALTAHFALFALAYGHTEERGLRGQHGKRYARYRTHVPALPRVRRAS